MAAMETEFANLVAHDAFHYAPYDDVVARGKRILRMTWVFKIKVDSEGRLSKYKARFCVVGTGQDKGEDFWESFASGA